MSININFFAKFLLFIIYSPLFLSEENKTLSKEFKNAMILNFTYQDALPLLRINLGDPPQRLHLILNTAIFHSTITNIKCNICNNTSVNLFNPQLSSTYKPDEDRTFSYLNSEMEGLIFFEKIYLYNQLDHVDYFGLSLITKYLNRTQLNNSGYLGLNRNYFNHGGNTFSIIDILFQDKFIIKKSFRFNFASNYSKNKLILGNVFNEYDNFTNNYTSCYSNHKIKIASTYLLNTVFSDYWYCNLSYIYFDYNSNSSLNDTIFLKNSILINKYAIFSTAEPIIISPIEYLGTIYNKIKQFFEFINILNKCTVINIKSAPIQVECNYNKSVNFNFIENMNFSLSLVFNGYAYIIENHNLFLRVLYEENNNIIKEIYEVQIRFDEKIQFFVIGMNFLRNFDIIFSKEFDEVGFYNGRKINLNNFTIDSSSDQTSRSNFSFKIFFGNLLILISVIAFIIWYIRRNKRKKELNKNYQSLLNNY